MVEIYRKEDDDNVLHDSIRATDGGGDDAAREGSPRRCSFVAGGTEGGTQAFAHELGRGHRRTWEAAAPHALGETGLLRAPVSTCNIPLTNPA